MLKSITITNEDIIQQVKLSGKIPEIVEQITSRKLILAAVEEAGMKVEAEELQEAANLFRLTHKLFHTKDTWKWLEKNCLSLDDFQEMVYNSIIFTKLTNYMFKDKIEPIFFENQLDYLGVVMYEVVLDDENLALELFYNIQKGDISFHDVAYKYIQDKELRRKGGYLGMVYRKNLQIEISAPVFASTPPQLLKPIVTDKGTHLIFVEEIIQRELDAILRHDIGLDLFSAWLKQELDKVEIIRQLD